MSRCGKHPPVQYNHFASLCIITSNTLQLPLYVVCTALYVVGYSILAAEVPPRETSPAAKS